MNIDLNVERSIELNLSVVAHALYVSFGQWHYCFLTNQHYLISDLIFFDSIIEKTFHDKSQNSTEKIVRILIIMIEISEK